MSRSAYGGMVFLSLLTTILFICSLGTSWYKIDGLDESNVTFRWTRATHNTEYYSYNELRDTFSPTLGLLVFAFILFLIALLSILFFKFSSEHHRQHKAKAIKILLSFSLFFQFVGLLFFRSSFTKNINRDADFCPGGSFQPAYCDEFKGAGYIGVEWATFGPDSGFYLMIPVIILTFVMAIYSHYLTHYCDHHHDHHDTHHGGGHYQQVAPQPYYQPYQPQPYQVQPTYGAAVITASGHF